MKTALLCGVLVVGLLAVVPCALGEEKAAPSSNTVVIGKPEAVKKAEESLPAVVAKVGDETITGKEFGKEIDFYQKTMESRVGSAMELDERQRYEFLQYAVDERVLEMLAKKEKVTATDEEVDAEYAKAKAKAGSEQEFKDNLSQLGFTEEDAKALMRSSMNKSKLVDAKTKDLAVTDPELQKEYDTLKAAGQLDRPESYNVAHILIKVEGKDEGAWTKGKDAIDAALKRVKSGENFGAVAKAVSQDPGSAEKGGVYTDVQAGMMVPQFEKVMMATPVGQVSEPFKTDYGWHILKVDGKNAAGTMELAAIKDDLSKYLLKKKKDEAVQKLVDEAKAGMKIEILLPKPAPEAAPADAAPAVAAPQAAAPAPSAEKK